MASGDNITILAPGALVAALGPWHELLKSADLILAPWHPALGYTATAVAIVAVVIAYFSYSSAKRSRLASLIKIFGAVAIAAVALCLIASAIVGRSWHPHGLLRDLVWLLWKGAYVVTFSALAVVATVAAIRLGATK